MEINDSQSFVRVPQRKPGDLILRRKPATNTDAPNPGNDLDVDLVHATRGGPFVGQDLRRIALSLRH